MDFTKFYNIYIGRFTNLQRKPLKNYIYRKPCLHVKYELEMLTIAFGYFHIMVVDVKSWG